MEITIKTDNKMKRLSMIMMCLLAMLVASLSAKAQEVTITLYPGCNWISYPNSEMLDINTALGDFVPVDGDIIQSQVNYSVYIDGQWRGSVTHFMPGWGYKYYSNRTETVSFTFSHTGTLPTVTTADPTGITLSGFTGGGEVVNTGNSVITVFGLCWGTNPNPTVNDFQAVAGYGMGSFTWEVEYLEMNTTYYVRAYALTENGMVYGEEKTFSTLTGIPVVTTMDVTEISYHQATCGGEVSDDGGLAVTDRGICWSTSPNPTVDGDHIASGSGLGSFSLNMTGLASFTTYYVRAYATNSHTTSYGEEMSFTTLEIPTYTITVMANPAEGGTVVGGDVIDLGQTCTVTAVPNTGYDFVNWTENGESVSTDLEYTFTVSADRTLVANFQLQSFTIAASADPAEGGSIEGAGTFDYGTSCTLTATPATGYDFVNWTENGTPVSTSASYTFTVSEARTLVANFQLQSFTITASANLAEYGSVSGAGIYNYGQSCTLTATPNNGYSFTKWTENGDVLSTDASYTFTVNGNRNVVAHFIPEGVIDGAFSVSSSQQVFFSQGNLQYQASTNTWRFAENQWNIVGGTSNGNEYGNVYENGMKCSNNNISATYTGWIDLFGWGTSGYNHGAWCYQPWSTYDGNGSYFAYGSRYYNLYDQTGQADWGFNPISNGGNQLNQWRSLTREEWGYVFNTRTTPSGIRYARAMVNDVKGVILLPDDWDASYYTLNNTNSAGANFSNNTITASDWSTLELHGAVFLPVAGSRSRNNVNFGEGYYVGYYWSASYSNASSSYCLYFYDTNLEPQFYGARSKGISVRLIRDERPALYIINVSATPAEGGTVSGGGIIELGQTCTMTATPATDYVFVSWTENGEVVSTEATYSFIVNENRNLVAHFAQNFEVNVTVSPTTIVFVQNDHPGEPLASGTVSGGGVYLPGEYCTVTTTANANYVFVNWTENGVVVSTNPTYSFAVNADRNLVANYRVGGYQQFVDLGLPSGTLWATCNLGADNPEDYGVYFDWGGTLPKEYYDGNFIDQSDFITKYCNNPDYGSQGYVDTLTVLLPEDDAATANWGADWRMPTKEEWNELFTHTTHYQTTRNGVLGLLFTSIDGHSSLFLPAAGWCYSNYFTDVDRCWKYWSSSLDTTAPRYACMFDGVYGAEGGYGRAWATPIRAVRTSD